MKKETEILKTPIFTVVEKEFKNIALNIVCKAADVNGKNVAKISNDKDKTSGYVEYLNRTIDWRIKSGE